MRAPWIAAAALLALAGCSSQITTTPNGVLLRDSPTASAAPSAPIFATELAGPETFLPPMPSAVVILKPEDMARNRAFCQAALALPSAQAVEAANTVAPNIIRTRWLVQIGDVAAAHARDCDYLVGVYDYARAARLMSSVHATEGGFFGRGPYLLLIIPDRTGLHVAGLNGSGYDQADFPRFIGNWSQALQTSQAQISATPDRPGVIRSIFDLVAAVLASVTGGAGGLVKGVFAGL